jgi:hypothetical protein
MSSHSEDDDDPVMRSSTERYDRVGVTFRWPQILASASSIFFGFLLNIAVNPPSYFTFLDNVILLAALYAVTVATAMFIMPVIFHASHYRKFDVERFLFRTKQYVLIGIICVMLAMYLGLGLALNSKLPVQIAYSLASLPFIFIFFELFRKPSTNPIKSSSTERYDRVGAAMRWCQILASASSIFFGFLLNIAVNPPSYFTFLDNVILLAALYAVTVATAMFIMPVIFHASHYRKFDVERFLFRTKEPVLIGIICVMLAMYLGLGLALTSKLPVQIAYSLASLPFIFIFFELFRHMHE